MRLLPSEVDRLQIFQAAELARRRRGRGLRLNQAEAVALITDEVMEAARDGVSYEQAERVGYSILKVGDVLPEVAPLVSRIELEALFADGSRLIVLHDPIGLEEPAAIDTNRIEPVWLQPSTPLEVTNEADVPVGITSHFHVFETNRRLRFDRAAAWGMRLAVDAGTKVIIEPGETRTVYLVPIGGARIVRGHAGLVDGPLDAPGAREAALEKARAEGYLGA